jgi:hypothetical protein
VVQDSIVCDHCLLDQETAPPSFDTFLTIVAVDASAVDVFSPYFLPTLSRLWKKTLFLLKIWVYFVSKYHPLAPSSLDETLEHQHQKHHNSLEP